MAFFKVNNVTKLFRNKKGVSDISFAIEKGEVVGLIGDNGAGKTTLIRSILGSYHVDKGEVLFDDHKMAKQDFDKICFFPDQTAFPVNVSIKNFSDYFLAIKGVKTKENILKLKKIMADFKIGDYWNKSINNLSSGMAKKMFIALMMVSGAELFILDEPTTALDVESRKLFVDIILYLQEHNKAILITSHLIDELQRIINHLVVLKDGKKIYDQKVSPNEDILKIYDSLYKRDYQKVKNVLNEINV